VTRRSRVHLQFESSRVRLQHRLSTMLPTPDQMQPLTASPKMTKNVHAKTKPQRKSSKATKGKQPLMQTIMMNVDPKYVRVNIVSSFITTTSRITRRVKK
jgi:predicted component of type VI protein secretion system